MSYNPLEFFSAGQKMGQSKGAGLSAGVGTVMDSFNRQLESKAKIKEALTLEKAKNKLEMDADVGAAQKIFGGSGGTGGFMPSEVKVGRTTYKNPGYSDEINKLRNDAAIDKKSMQGAGPEAGKLTLAEEAVKNIRDMRKMLFPGGDSASFQRQAAYSMKPWPFNKPIPNSYEGQTLFRKSGASISGRQLLQTGVAARPEEHEELGRQFIADAFSNPRAAYDSLDELESFYNSYMQKADPSGLFHGQQRADTANDASRGGGIDIGEERKKVADKISAGGYDANKLKQIFKDRTGQEF